ncbi:E3 ubiquitin-protein ligase TRIM39-like [Podarcis raffonei]|uniref:E3 ubiquitin-protein ligase TRIM39-like n=1 Tax=Podarcis raffonei TaxID=65483 RepID=UPI002329549A|nr:E3 ubiquitin-protein ligase TRIM39-like [Podarcis raffonei]XP_053217335.1 E3 ubiquitin-protein ligase TRIM39-like [Podarcis raffonei]XP_053217336.1 E3 ubiquitin-protein ligase TRIM39-like [Podarcis raffonei]XP_053217337.1 E3 ubiquitin-protein ligase TRIM39-like [Podarcis raffonei]XP_053217338.1 E3 ubiquitin-protein ligase TRIM39-like [Podarcis raffonei]
MSNSVCCKLVDYLDELTEEEFKRFKMHLEDYPLEQGYKPIRHCKTEKADLTEIARLMVRAYEEAKALQMTVNILDRINRKDLSAKVKQEMSAFFLQPTKAVASTREEKRKREERLLSSITDKFCGTQKKVEVTLDPKTAFPTLILSEDRKSVYLGRQAQVLPDNPERFNFSPCVLGAEGITSGTMEWVVEVGKAKAWAIGAVRESIGRKWYQCIRVTEGFWALQLTEGEYMASTSPSTVLPLWKSPRRIKILLEYDFEILSFYDADSMELIYTFNYPFSERMFPFFQVWDTEIPLKIS